MRAARRIRFRAIGGDKGVLVRLPHLFWLYRAFREAFPRAKPGCRVWTWIVRGRTALRRLGLFDKAHGDRAAAEVRQRERARQDAEWDALTMLEAA